MTLIERTEATQRTLDWFAPRPFDWRKSATCVHLVRRHLMHMGHSVPGSDLGMPIRVPAVR